MNSINLIGNITNDLEMKVGSNGTSFVFFTLAVNEYVKGEEKPNFIPCVAFDKLAESLCKYNGKGSKIAVSGRITSSSKEQEDGKKRTFINVMANHIEFLNSKMSDEKVNEQLDTMKVADHNSNDDYDHGDLDKDILWD